MIDEKKLLEEINRIIFEADIHKSYVQEVFDDIVRTIKGQPKVGEWIACDVDIPKESGSYLIQCRVDLISASFGIHKARYSTDTGKWKASEGNSFFDNVIAWQPLPEPFS